MRICRSGVVGKQACGWAIFALLKLLVIGAALGLSSCRTTTSQRGPGAEPEPASAASQTHQEAAAKDGRQQSPPAVVEELRPGGLPPVLQVGSGGVTEPATPVLVFLGGNSSCFLGSSDPSTPVKQALASLFDLLRTNVETSLKRPTVSLVSCYGIDSGDITYVLSSAPADVRSESVASMYQALNGLLKSVKNPRLVIVGHSHGGWTAMDLTLQLDPGWRVATLVTLDPISRVNCTPQRILAASAMQSVEPGCLQAPSDFGDAKLGQMAARAGAWLNFYEDSSVLLHSSVVKGALNSHLSYPGPSVEAHSQFLHDDEVAAAIQKQVLKSLLASP